MLCLSVQGSFPPPCGPESVCSLLDEGALLGYVKEGAEQRTPFKYYVLDGGTIVALLEQSLGNDEGESVAWGNDEGGSVARQRRV